MTSGSPVRPNIVCLVCREIMRVHHEQYSAARRGILVATECSCGRVIGLVPQPLGDSPPHYSSNDLDTSGLSPNDVAGRASQAVADAHQRIADAEKWIAAATWALARPRPTSDPVEAPR